LRKPKKLSEATKLVRRVKKHGERDKKIDALLAKLHKYDKNKR
jgi:hypothetical protein